jgi:Cof subfamily protein (haloacid dehalogenase superfamily)
MSAIPVMDELGLSGTLITHNGAATVTSEKNLIHNFSFSAESIQPYVMYCRDKEIHFDINTAFEMFLEDATPEALAMYAHFFATPEKVADVLQLSLPWVKFTCFGSKEEMDLVESDWLKMKLPLRLIRSGDFFIDVMNPSANKGNALKALAEKLDVAAEEVIAIGNYYNDLEMLEYAGLGIAMENSPDLVKEKANAVTVSNNHEGVYAALTKYYV